MFQVPPSVLFESVVVVGLVVYTEPYSVRFSRAQTTERLIGVAKRAVLVRNGGVRRGSLIDAVPCRFSRERHGKRPFFCHSFSVPYSTGRSSVRKGCSLCGLVRRVCSISSKAAYRDTIFSLNCCGKWHVKMRLLGDRSALALWWALCGVRRICRHVLRPFP